MEIPHGGWLLLAGTWMISHCCVPHNSNLSLLEKVFHFPTAVQHAEVSNGFQNLPNNPLFRTVWETMMDAMSTVRLPMVHVHKIT